MARRDWAFQAMSWTFAVRDLWRPPERHMMEAGLQAGDTVLDFGCGPGGFTLAAADMVLPHGIVYALDRNPAALQMVKKRARRRGFEQLIRTIQSPLITGLPNGSVDVVMLYDVLHQLEDIPAVLQELHRVLKGDGLLSVAIHHMPRPAGVSVIVETGLFRVAHELPRTVGFNKRAP